MYLIQGLVLGISISIVIGPMIFLFLNASMTNGIRGSLIIGVGAWTSDLIYICASYWGMSYLAEVINNPFFKSVTGLLGGLLLVIIGLVLQFQGRRPIDIGDKKPELIESNFALFTKGFLINMLNPFCAIIWFGAISTIMISGAADISDMALFVMGSLGIVIISDIFKIHFSNYIVSVLSGEYQEKLKRIASIGFLICGILLMVKVM